MASEGTSSQVLSRPEVSREVPFRLFRDYVVVAEGTLGNLSGCNLLIDTGSSPTIVDRSVTKRLGLLSRPAWVFQLNGDSKAGAAVLPTVTLGPVSAHDLPVLVADLSSSQHELGIHVDAIVGLDVLRARSFAIDYRAHKIIFGQLPISTNSVPFESSPPLITVKVQVEGRPLRLLVDTGASGLILFRKNDEFRGLRVQSLRNSDNITGTFSREQVEVSDVRLGELYRRRQVAYLVRSQENVSRDFDGLAGIPALGIKQIAFDFEHGRLSWK